MYSVYVICIVRLSIAVVALELPNESNKLSNECPIQTEVCQGDVASPLLFNITINSIMRKAFEDRHGYQYIVNIFANSGCRGHTLPLLNYSIAHSYSIKINVDKTKVMTGWITGLSSPCRNLNRANSNIQIPRMLVQGKKVASTTKAHSKIGQATVVFTSLRWCLWQKAIISSKTKIHLQALILPILLYILETWTRLKSDLNKLGFFEMQCLK